VIDAFGAGPTHHTCDRWGSSSDTSLIRVYRTDYNNRPSNDIFFMSTTSTSGRLHSEFVLLLFLQVHRQTDRFFAAAGVVQFVSSTSNHFHYRHGTFSSHINSKIGNILGKDAALRINLNIDGAPITSKSHTHPSHSQTCRLLTSSLSLGMSVPRATQVM
jgi:hypothetical protein